MKILLVSDLHGFHTQLKIANDIEMVICCGDFTNYKNPFQNAKEALDFLSWYDEQPVKHKVLIAGNHDTSIEKGIVNPHEYETITYLHHEAKTVGGIDIFGSPYTPEFCNWSFNIPRDKLDVYWHDIPFGLDVLATHGPPKGILDACPDYSSGIFHAGDEALYREVLIKQPKYHAFGHIHNNGKNRNEGIGWITGSEIKTEFHNVSCVTDGKFDFGLTSQGHVIEINK